MENESWKTLYAFNCIHHDSANAIGDIGENNMVRWSSVIALCAKYDVKGNELWWSEILNEPIKREFRSTDKKIILPYNEVF